MTVQLDTYYGKVTFSSSKIDHDFDLSQVVDQLEKLKLFIAFFPLHSQDINSIEFTPRVAKFETKEYKDKLISYLKQEAFLDEGGSFPINVLIPQQ